MQTQTTPVESADQSEQIARRLETTDPRNTCKQCRRHASPFHPLAITRAGWVCDRCLGTEDEQCESC